MSVSNTHMSVSNTHERWQVESNGIVAVTLQKMLLQTDGPRILLFPAFLKARNRSAHSPLLVCSHRFTTSARALWHSERSRHCTRFCAVRWCGVCRNSLHTSCRPEPLPWDPSLSAPFDSLGSWEITVFRLRSSGVRGGLQAPRPELLDDAQRGHNPSGDDGRGYGDCAGRDTGVEAQGHRGVGAAVNDTTAAPVSRTSRRRLLPTRRRAARPGTWLPSTSLASAAPTERASSERK